MPNDGGGATYDLGWETATSANGSVVAVSMPGDDSASSNQGSVLVYRLNATSGSYYQAQKLEASDGAAEDVFGHALDISADGVDIIVGARGDDTSTGSVYVFRENPSTGVWSQVKKLVSNDAETYDYAADAISIYENRIAVGVSSDNTVGGNDAGAVYIYNRSCTTCDDWEQSGRVFASDGADTDYFGRSVVLKGDTLVVGAFYKDYGGSSNTGAVYVFTSDANGVFTETQKLMGSINNADDNFGTDKMALQDDILAIGAYTDEQTERSGSVYIFRKNSSNLWTEESRLFASDASRWDEFGRALDISGPYLVVGSHDDDDEGSDQGSAYVFELLSDDITWVEKYKLKASDGAGDSRFGHWVNINGLTVVSGAWKDNSRVGAAYVYSLPAPVTTTM